MKGTSVILVLLLTYVGVTLAANNRVWSIVVGDSWGAHEYRDSGGYIKGFGIDFLDMVCAEGRMDCRMTWMPYQNCWNSSAGVHPAAGPAIHSRWADGCAGFAVTVERIHTVKFTKSWMKRIEHFFFTLKGNGRNFDPNNIGSKKIGFVQGWAANEVCVARSLNPLKPEQMQHLESPAQLLGALKSRTLDAVFSTEQGWTEAEAAQLDKVNTALYCSLAGTSIMTRKDSDFPSVFNTAFNKILNTPKFGKFCVEANKAHASDSNKIECVE